jgi:hypothetical protein
VIEFVCTCGKRLKVQDDLAGQPVRCPACEAAVRVPAPEDELSGPEALQAAMRDIQQNGAAGAPVAETADTPVDLDEAAKGLDALARTAGGGASRPSRPKRTARRAAGSSRTRKPARAAARKPVKPKPGPRQVQAPRSRASGSKSDAKRKQAMIVGGFAALGLLLIIVIVAVAMHDDPPPPPPPEETATYMPETETPRPRGPYTGHQPGELFNHVPFDDEREGGDADGAGGS